MVSQSVYVVLRHQATSSYSSLMIWHYFLAMTVGWSFILSLPATELWIDASRSRFRRVLYGILKEHLFLTSIQTCLCFLYLSLSSPYCEIRLPITWRTLMQKRIRDTQLSFLSYLELQELVKLIGSNRYVLSLPYTTTLISHFGTVTLKTFLGSSQVRRIGCYFGMGHVSLTGLVFYLKVTTCFSVFIFLLFSLFSLCSKVNSYGTQPNRSSDSSSWSASNWLHVWERGLLCRHVLQECKLLLR